MGESLLRKLLSGPEPAEEGEASGRRGGGRQLVELGTKLLDGGFVGVERYPLVVVGEPSGSVLDDDGPTDVGEAVEVFEEGGPPSDGLGESVLGRRREPSGIASPALPSG